MHQTNLSKYAAYIKEKANIELIENEHGFVTYSINNGHAFIYDAFVEKEHRGKNIGKDLLKQVEIIAWAAKCKYVLASVQINSNGSNEALLTQLLLGFKVIGANEKEINLAKEILWAE